MVSSLKLKKSMYMNHKELVDQVSSTLIRNFLEKGFLNNANSLLKRNWCVEGKVIKGIHLGSYESSEAMHYGIIDYAKGMNLEIIGSPWEVYANDPTEVDSSKIER